MQELNKLIENEVIIENNIFFSVIIGSSPSKGARSPLLWNYAFKKNGYNYKMFPLDVKKENLKNLLELLEKNKYFLGGAITIPHKEEVFKIMNNNLTEEASYIGAVNCMFRDDNYNIKGTNTDGEASLKVFIEKFGSINNKKILLLGPGGAGKAVSIYFLKELKNKKNLYIAARSINAKKFINKIKANWLDWNEIQSKINLFDIIINCTNIGSGTLSEQSPLDLSIINQTKNKVVIYDIIYDPSPTILLKYAISKKLSILDGKMMNLEQAVIAFDYCLKKNQRKIDTRSSMLEKINLIE